MIYNITLTTNHQTLTAEYLPLAAESVQYLTAKVICETEDWTAKASQDEYRGVHQTRLRHTQIRPCAERADKP